MTKPDRDALHAMTPLVRETIARALYERDQRRSVFGSQIMQVPWERVADEQSGWFTTYMDEADTAHRAMIAAQEGHSHD
jgi:hypothetical protein